MTKKKSISVRCKTKINYKKKAGVTYNNKDNIKRGIMIFLVIILALSGVTYAFFNYLREGDINQLIVGKIYMHYDTSKTISLWNAEPRSNLDSNTYIEFSVEGLNEYQESDIWYAIDLEYGDIPSGKTSNNRIRDDLLRFTLTKKINDASEQVVINGAGYDSINDLRIYVETIPAGITNSLTHTYKLYMWISDDIVVGNSENADYSIDEWNNMFASIKLKVVGDFIPKGAINSIKVTFDGNGGSVSTPYRYYNQNDVYGTLPVATKEGYVFEGWRAANNVKVHANKELQYNENHTLTAIYSIIKYRHPGEYTFDGTNYINTGISLFDEDNIDRNFYISFDITQVDGDNNSNATAIFSQVVSEPKYGFWFNRNGTSNQFRMSSNGNVENYLRSNIYYGAQNIKIIRINGIMYYSLNDGGFAKCGDYTDFSNYFNTPVIFGASLNSSGSLRYFFKGKLSNMMIKIIVDDDVSLDDFLYSTNRFEYDGDLEFNGSTAINTGVYLFSEDNVTKSFYISFDIKNINWNVKQSTIMSSKDEHQSPWPGFELRRYGTSNVYMQSKATVSQGNANDVTTIPISTNNVRFLRVNNGSTVKLYYSLNGGDFILHKDFTSFNLYFNVPVVFGNAYNVETQRYFRGTLSNIIVKFIEDNEAISICGNTCS